MKGFSPGRLALRRFYLVGLVLLAILVALGWQQLQVPQGALLRTEAPQPSLVQEPIQPLPSNVSFDERKVALGQVLFNEPRLSKDSKVACISCHDVQAGGADGKRYSAGVGGAMTTVNTPTVFNVAYNFRFNWNGKFRNLVEHTDALIQNSAVMGSSWPELLTRLKADPNYPTAFAEVYGDGITRPNVIDAIVAYETALITPGSRFDRYLNGDSAALSADETAGYSLFKAYGCVSCHQGVNLGGNLFQKFGVIGDYFADRGNVTQADLGRFNVTQAYADRYLFRVPSLRNVAATPPYLHDGSAATLEEAITIMVTYQLGRDLTPEKIQQIAQFLRTLTAEPPKTLTAGVP
ncbi:MAG: cytochrome-c peroxidase [Elainellaceae cyanobacterium]